MKTLAFYLQTFGLTKNESKFYSVVLSNNVEKASEIARISGIPRNKVYEIAENLVKKGFIEIIPEKVKKFRAISLENSLKSQINNAQEKVNSMEKTKDVMNKYIESLTKKEKIEHDSGYFAVYKSKNIILMKIKEMLSNSKSKVHMMINSSDLRRFMYDVKNISNKIDVNVLSPVISENKIMAEKWSEFSNFRHYTANSQIKIIISDNKEIILFKLDSPTALYSKDRQFISLFMNLFDSMWSSSINFKDRIVEIETGKPPETIQYVKGRTDFFSVLQNILSNVKKDVMIATTSNGVLRINKYLKPHLEKLAKNGVKIRVLVPINKRNSNIAKKLDFIEIRHLENIPSVISCHDDSHLVLLQINSDTPNDESPEDLGIITTQKSMVKMVKNMFEYMWSSSMNLDERIEELNEIKVNVSSENVLKNNFVNLRDLINKKEN